MLRYFESEDRQKSSSPTGYIGSEIVMVAKTGYILLNSIVKLTFCLFIYGRSFRNTSIDVLF